MAFFVNSLSRFACRLVVSFIALKLCTHNTFYIRYKLYLHYGYHFFPKYIHRLVFYFIFEYSDGVLGGPYGVFAGRDASRGLATFSLTEEAIKDEYDDLSDLSSTQMDSVREWEMQFTGLSAAVLSLNRIKGPG